MSDCYKFEDHLTLYYEGALSSEERKEIHRHVEICEVCQTKIETWRSYQNRVRKLPRLRVSPEFENRLHQRIREINSSGSEEGLQKWRIPALVTVGLAAIVFVILMTPGTIDNPQFQPTHTKKEAASRMSPASPRKSPQVNREVLQAIQAARGISLDSSARKLNQDSVQISYRPPIKTVKE